MADISPELVERMVALVRDLHADHLRYDLHDREQNFCKRTAAIVADLPVPVDPDLIEAREIAAARYSREDQKRLVLDGKWDCGEPVVAALAGIKRGRELAALTHEMEAAE
jgi:hypothetical protein